MTHYTALLCWLFFFHWLADFIFQTRQMANNKSKSNYWLSRHVVAYTVVLALGTMLAPGIGNAPLGSTVATKCLLFIGLNGSIHWVIDWCTSKMTTTFWKQSQIDPEAYHRFFAMIGFDQLLHIIVLTITANCLLLQ